jgi:hypothetical protein
MEALPPEPGVVAVAEVPAEWVSEKSFTLADLQHFFQGRDASAMFDASQPTDEELAEFLHSGLSTEEQQIAIREIFEEAPNPGEGDSAAPQPQEDEVEPNSGEQKADIKNEAAEEENVSAEEQKGAAVVEEQDTKVAQEAEAAQEEVTENVGTQKDACGEEGAVTAEDGDEGAQEVEAAADEPTDGAAEGQAEETEAGAAEKAAEEETSAAKDVSVCPGPLGLILDKRQPNRAVVIGFEPLPSGVCGELEYHPSVQPGSVIVAVNGIDTSSMPMAQVMELLASSQFAEDRVISFLSGEVEVTEADEQEEEDSHQQKEEYKILYDPDTGIKLKYNTSYRATYVGWASKFDQIVALSEHGFAVLDLKTRKEQSRWTYSSVRNISLEDDAVGFALTLQKEGNQMSTLKYRSQYRLHLLSDLVRLRDLSISASHAVRASRQYAAIKVRRNQQESELFLEVTPCSLNQVACDEDKTTLSRYLYKDMQAVYPCDDRAASLVVVHGGRAHWFTIKNDATKKRDELVERILQASQQLGIERLCKHNPASPPPAPSAAQAGAQANAVVKKEVPPLATFAEWKAQRLEYSKSAHLLSLATFVVSKLTLRHPREHARRQLVITPRALLEREHSTHDVISAYALGTIFCIIRYKSDARRFTLELKNGMNRTYFSPDRDALLANLLDCVHNLTGVTVPVNEVPTPGLRVFPRFASEDVKAMDGFFSNDSMEVRILRRIGAALTTEGTGMEVVIAAAELNANVRCSGVLATAKRDLVLGALFPLLATLKKTPDHAEIESTVVVELLQAIHRCVQSSIGFRCLLTDVGASECLESLLTHPSRHQAVLYWTLRVIQELVASTNQPTRDREQECVNKRELFLRGKFPSLLVGLLLPLKHRPAVGPLVTMVLVATIESVLVSHADTTPKDCFNSLLLEVARQFDRVLALLRSKCAVTLQHTALILKVHHTPYTIHHTLYTIHHTPYTIHHTPYTIHHTPFSLHADPQGYSGRVGARSGASVANRCYWPGPTASAPFACCLLSHRGPALLEPLPGPYMDLRKRRRACITKEDLTRRNNPFPIGTACDDAAGGGLGADGASTIPPEQHFRHGGAGRGRGRRGRSYHCIMLWQQAPRPASTAGGPRWDTCLCCLCASKGSGKPEGCRCSRRRRGSYKDRRQGTGKDQNEAEG